MKTKGYFLTILSAVIFGFTPILAKITYSMGSNGITMAFFRHLFVIPILFLIMKCQRLPYKITLHQLKNICLVGIIGNALTVAALYWKVRITVFESLCIKFLFCNRYFNLIINDWTDQWSAWTDFTSWSIWLFFLDCSFNINRWNYLFTTGG